MKMKNLLTVFAGIILASGINAQSWNLTFYPDSGFRIENAAIPRIFYDDSTEIYYLYYDNQGGGGGGSKYATSDDGLNFSDPQNQPPPSNISDSSYVHSPKIANMHDSIYKNLWFNGDTLVSATSTDRINFTEDPGYCYILQAGDNNTCGVFDFFTLSPDSVVFIYIGDMFGANNCRIAISTDNGQSFTFVSDNPLGDIAAGGGSNAYVDPKATKMKFGYRLYTMKGGNKIYSFSTVNGINYVMDAGTRLQTTDFTQFTSLTLNDPHVIRLPDGRFRMYVASSVADVSDTTWNIVSATTDFPTEINDMEYENNIDLFPNPVSSELNISLKNQTNKIESISVYSLTGTLIRQYSPYSNDNNLKIDISDIGAGMYLLNISTSEGKMWKKFIVSR